MATTQAFPGIPALQLPSWANKGAEGSLSQRFLDRYGAKPKLVDGGWIGDLGPGYGKSLGLSQWPLNPVPGAPFNNPIAGTSGLTASGSKMPIIGSADSLNTGPVTSTTMQTPDISRGSGANWGALESGAKQLAPFISNIANSLRRPPQSIRPGMASPITFSRINNSNERANIDTATRAQDLGADRGLDGNTAASYKAANLATKLHAYGDSYSRENNANVQIANEQSQFNSGIQRENLAKTDAYNDKVVESKIAQQRNQSANLANASDKFVAIQNANAERTLKEKEFTEASRLFNPGVAERYAAYNKNPAAFWTEQQQAEAQRQEEERKLNEASRATPKGTTNTPTGRMGGALGGRSMKLNVGKMRKVYK